MEPMKPMEPMRPMQPSAAEPGWWPAELGHPASSGAQDGVRYAWFPEARRVAVERDGAVTLHDSGERRITGISQGGGRDGALVLGTADGPVPLRDLPEIR